MNKYFEKIINVLGIVIAIATSLLESFSLEIKLLTFVTISFITILISYINSTIKYKKLLSQNTNLIKDNDNLKQQINTLNEKCSLQETQLQSYSDNNTTNKIVII